MQARGPLVAGRDFAKADAARGRVWRARLAFSAKWARSDRVSCVLQWGSRATRRHCTIHRLCTAPSFSACARYNDPYNDVSAEAQFPVRLGLDPTEGFCTLFPMDSIICISDLQKRRAASSACRRAVQPMQEFPSWFLSPASSWAGWPRSAPQRRRVFSLLGPGNRGRTPPRTSLRRDLLQSQWAVNGGQLQRNAEPTRLVI
jgi:hypothetical protein